MWGMGGWPTACAAKSPGATTVVDLNELYRSLLRENSAGVHIQQVYHLPDIIGNQAPS